MPSTTIPRLQLPERDEEGDVTTRTQTLQHGITTTSSSDAPSSGEDVALQRVAVAQSLEEQQARLLAVSPLATITEAAEPPQQGGAAASSAGTKSPSPTPRTQLAGGLQRMELDSSTPKPKGPPQ